MFEFVFEESLFAFAYATPPFVFELLFDRRTTRVLCRFPPDFLVSPLQGEAGFTARR